MGSDDAPVPAGHPDAANDNDAANAPPRAPAPLSPKIEAALRQIAQAIGRHLARETIHDMRACNDNERP